MSKISRSWAIFRRSLTVLKLNKKLFFFPIITFICTIGIFTFFFAPVVLQPTGHSYSDIEHWKAVGSSIVNVNEVAEAGEASEAGEQPGGAAAEPEITFSNWAVVYLAVLYFVSIFLATFFNVAFYNEILNALNGKPTSIIGGLRFAMSRLVPILFWSLLAGTVGYVIKALEQKFGIFGRFVMRFIGLAWSVACVFVVPVIVREEKQANPINYLKRSTSVIRKTWGEALAGYVGMKGLGLLVFAGMGVLWLVGIVLAFFLFSSDALIIAYLLGGLALWIFLSIAFAYICAVMEKIYIGALYIYASEGVIPEAYDQETLDTAWKVK